MRVTLSEAAFADLLDIGQNIKKDNPIRAESFVNELYDCCQKLGFMPHAYPLLFDWEEYGIRRRTYGNYSIFYCLGDNTVEILHIFHGARDYDAVLFLDKSFNTTSKS